MTKATSTDDSISELVRMAICAPLSLVVEASRRLPNAVNDGEKQLMMARNLGRIALRAATVRRDSTPTVDDNGAASPRAVDGYGSMTAREIIALVGDADAATRQWIKMTETKGKGRVTVLRALDRHDDSTT